MGRPRHPYRKGRGEGCMNQKKFLEWLRQQGAEVLAPTNPYELARFRARGGVHIIYEGRRGVNATGFAEECVTAFAKGSPLWMGMTQKPRNSMGYKKAALMERDGNECFYCHVPMSVTEATVEHLVSRQNGGPDHMDNLALAHDTCNRRVANLPLVKKLDFRGWGKMEKSL